MFAPLLNGYMVIESKYMWLPSKVVLGIRRSFLVIHKKKRKTLIVRSFLYLQIIFNSSVLQITT